MIAVRSSIRRLALLGALLGTFASCSQTSAPTQPTFASPEEAVRSLIDVAKTGTAEEVVAIFGAEGKGLLDSSDPATARRNRDVFVVAAGERWILEDAGPDKKVLVIGNERWPFPVPLTKDANRWRFDTAAGREEVLARRIGRNELSVIRICGIYVAAQRVYASRGHDGQTAGIYATAFRSDSGKQNGLYWQPGPGEKRSPLGDLVANAAAEGRTLGGTGAGPAPFHGYYFKILTSQGAAAPGGAKDYVADGKMSGGFALIAWPSEYDVTGVMTFIVNQDGTVHEKDLGPDTTNAVGSITSYNPDPTWTTVPQ